VHACEPLISSEPLKNVFSMSTAPLPLSPDHMIGLHEK